MVMLPVTILLHSEVYLRERIDPDALTHYVSAFQQVLDDAISERVCDSTTGLRVFCALLPERKRLMEVQWESSQPPTAQQDELMSRLSGLAVPLVRSGPVGFVIQFVPSTSEHQDTPFRFPHPFIPYRGRRTGQTLDEILMETAGLPFAPESPDAKPRRRWWSALKALVTGTGRQAVTEVNAPAESFGEVAAGEVASGERVGSTGESPPPDELARLLQSDEVEEAHLSDAIARFPRCAPLFKCRAKLHAREQQWQAAIDDATRFLELQPDDTDCLVLRGDIHCNTGRIEQGLIDFNTALRMDPSHVAARTGRGQVYMELSAWSAAEDDFSAALDNARHRTRLYVFRARAHIAQSQGEAALDDLSCCLRDDPHHDEAYLLRAMLRRQIGPRDGDIEGILEQIESDLDHAVRLGRHNPAPYVQRAELRLSAQRFDEAVADCERAIALDPDCGWAYGIRAIAFRSTDHMDEAMSDCDEAERLEFHAPEVSFTRAIVHYNEDERESALDACDETIALDAKHVGAFTMRGMIHLESGELDEALDDFNGAAELAPDNSEVYMHRGNTYRMREEPERALEDYNRAIELDSEAIGAYMNRALCLEDREEFDAALEDLTSVIERSPELVPAYDFRARIWSHKAAWDKVRSDLDEALRRDADYAPAYFNRGHLSLREGKYGEAKADFDELLRICPTLPAAYSSRGDALMHQGDHEQAEQDYREAIQLDPGSAEAYAVHRLLVEASYFRERSQFREAIRCATEALEQDHECAPALDIRAGAYWYSEQLVEAVDDYTRLVEISGESITACNGRGHALAELGEFEEALADLDRAVELAEPLQDPTGVAYALNGRALAMAGLRRYDEADRDFERSLESCPDNGWTHYNRGLMLRQQGNLADAARCFLRALESSSPPLSPRKKKRAQAFVDSQ